MGRRRPAGRPRRELAELTYGDRSGVRSDPIIPTDPDQSAENEPDARFTYANERTFLAWNRTALALIATGVAATQLLPKFQVAWGRRILGLPLIALGAILAITSFVNWRSNERAMRRGQPLPRSVMPLVLSCRHRRGRSSCHRHRGCRKGVATVSSDEDPNDPGLARERTALSWNRSGLAIIVCIAVVLRHLWPLNGTDELVALGIIAAAAIVWALALLSLYVGRERA